MLKGKRVADKVISFSQENVNVRLVISTKDEVTAEQKSADVANKAPAITLKQRRA